MEKERYEKLTLEITEFDGNDIITTSPPVDDESEKTPELPFEG
jgi:hypothetical protein